jgi:hypothetical protein
MTKMIISVDYKKAKEFFDKLNKANETYFKTTEDYDKFEKEMGLDDWKAGGTPELNLIHLTSDVEIDYFDENAILFKLDNMGLDFLIELELSDELINQIITENIMDHLK